MNMEVHYLGRYGHAAHVFFLLMFYLFFHLLYDLKPFFHCCIILSLLTNAMLPAAPVVAVPFSFDYAAAVRESNGSCSERDDIFMTMETECKDPGFDFLAVQQPKAALIENETFQREKQITVDPISLKGSTIRQASFRLVSPPLTTAQKSSGGPNFHLPLPPPKLKFVSASLPNSAASSPLKKIWKNQQNDASTRPASKLSRQQSAMDDSHFELQGSSTRRRSKSMGEGRLTTASDDFDLWLEKPSAGGSKFNDKQKSRSFPKPEVKEGRSKRGENREIPEDGFKCGKLCLFLPTRGKGKPVRPSPSISSSSQKTEAAPVISRTVSLEKFECGSWSPSALINEDGEPANLFFDLPLELIRCSLSDMQSPVTAAFVFDKETKLEKESKGVQKNGSVNTNGASKSQDSSRHVRFSTSSHPSSPSCITPRLRKAREDFNALLEAQSA